MQKSREPRGRVNWLAAEARERLLDACDGGPDWLAPAIVVLIGTGLRLGELKRLRWRDVDLAGRDASLTVHESKNDKRRRVPLAGEALETLRVHAKVRRLDDDRVFPAAGRNFHRAWYAALAHAEAAAGPILGDEGEPIRVHDLRHTFASLMAQSGVSLVTLAAIMGHSQIQMTMRYAHLCSAHHDGAVATMTERFTLDPRKPGET